MGNISPIQSMHANKIVKMARSSQERTLNNTIASFKYTVLYYSGNNSTIKNFLEQVLPV